LKIGAQVLLIKNLDVERGLVNGAQGEVVGFDRDRQNYPIVNFPDIHIKRVMVPEAWKIEIQGEQVASRTQIPLTLAWALSVHKCQGMTLSSVQCELGNVFTTGQAYVALSRARTLDGRRRALSAHIHNSRSLRPPLIIGLSLTSLPRSFATDPVVVAYYDSLEKQQNAASTY
jgi:ATP-dependent exoDNAse (exonuclease V) alpha subunit